LTVATGPYLVHDVDGPCGRQILAEDPSGSVVELLEARS